MIKEKLPIHKQYLVVSAPVEFSLIANNGTDKVLRPAGVWQLDCYKLLPEKYMANYPVFNLELEYDETKIPDGFTFEYYFTNINLGDSLKGVSGDLVELSEYQFTALKNIIGFSEDYPQYKVISKQNYKNFTEVDDGILNNVLFNAIETKVIYIGFTFLLKDGSRVVTHPTVLYKRTDTSILSGSFSFFYWVNTSFIGGRVGKIKTSGLKVNIFNDGFCPTFTTSEYDEENILSFLTFKNIPFDSIESLEISLLV